MFTFKSTLLCTAAAIAAGLMAQPAFAGAHTWRITEVFSNADGTIQFVELQECCGGTGEIFLQGGKVTSQATGNQFTFPANLVPPTSNKYLLLGTAGYAALPGAPAPDYVIPANFFDRNGDTLRYQVYDTWTFGSGLVPIDCTSSLYHSTGLPGPNSPTNYSGSTGSISCAAPQCMGDINHSGAVNIDDLLAVINNWGPAGGNGPADVDHNGVVNIDDLLSVINHWGACQ